MVDRDIDECREIAKDADATASQGKSGQVSAVPRQGARSDLQPGQWVVRWVVIRDATQWSEQPVA